MDNFTKYAADPTEWNGPIMKLAVLTGQPPAEYDTPENRALVELAAQSGDRVIDIVKLYRRLVEIASQGGILMSEAAVFELVGAARTK